MIYKAFAESVIRYGLIIYGSALKTTISSIDSAQRRILRAISFANKTGTSKVGAISKAQIAQNTFFGKKLEIFDFFSENVA